MNAAVRLDYRADTVGSLLRPDYLEQAVEQHDTGAVRPWPLWRGGVSG